MTAPASQSRRPGDGPAIVAKSAAWSGVTLLALAVGFALYFLVPKLEAYWRDVGAQPPLAGRLLISVSHALVNYFWVVAIVVFLAWAFSFFSSTPRSADRPD